MGWLFGRKKAVPKVPFPEGKPFDEKALRFPAPSSSERVIEPEKVKEAVGFAKPTAFPEEEEMAPEEMPVPSYFPFLGSKKRPATMPSPFESAPTFELSSRQELYVKIEVYQKMLGEMDELRKRLLELGEANKRLETSEYNEEHNFNKLRKFMKSLHDSLLHADKTLFKAQGE